MLTKAKEKLIKSLQTKKGREESGLCLVEGIKNIEAAGKSIEFTFKRGDTKIFDKLITTETPQDIAGLAKIPKWQIFDIVKKPVIVVLDGIQDPSNLGAILRLCLAFDTSLILIDTVDISSPKVIRSSVGSIFKVPWIKINRKDSVNFIKNLNRPIYRLENKLGKNLIQLTYKNIPKLENKIVLIAGSEGQGISLNINGISLAIPQNKNLESLNVGHALAIVLSALYNSR